MGTKVLTTQLNTDQPLAAVQEATITVLRSLGGSIQQNEIGFELTQASNGITFAFTANFKTLVNIRPLRRGGYEVECMVQWNPNGLFWFCLVVGIFVFGILWVVPLLYIFVDPTNAYQQTLYRLQGYFPVEQLDSQAALPTVHKTETNLAKRLTEAQQMFKTGLMTEEEYASYKQTILHSL